jgi:hypothetical protein
MKHDMIFRLVWAGLGWFGLFQPLKIYEVNLLEVFWVACKD